LPGNPLTVSCHIERDRSAEVDGAFCLWMGFPGGEIALSLVAFDAHYRPRYSLSGTRGRVEVVRAFAVPPQMQTRIMLETDAGEEDFVCQPADQFRLMLDDFCDQIQGASPRKDYEADLLLQHAVMDASARSNRERRAIDLSDYPL
jgi:predicted dehydrogenase